MPKPRVASQRDLSRRTLKRLKDEFQGMPGGSEEIWV